MLHCKCPHYAVMRALRAQLREQLVCEVGEEKVRSWEELDDEQQYQALLSDYFWGINAVVVNAFVQEYLLSLWDARQLVIRSNRQQWRGTPWP
jgi:hypothetical protein